MARWCWSCIALAVFYFAMLSFLALRFLQLMDG
jgi:hypothetical protein